MPHKNQKIRAKKNTKKTSNLSTLIKVKDQALKKQQQALKVKDQALKEYQKAIQTGEELIKEVTKTLAQQLKMAQEIHHILLPSKLPVVPGCEFSFKFQPATQEGYGKDFYEISPHPAHRSFSLTLSSTMSHSLSALLFSARLKMMSQKKQDHPLLPEEFLNQLREELNLGPLGKKEDRSPPSLSASLIHLNQDLESKHKKDKTTNDLKFFKSFAKPLEKISLFHALVNQKTYQMFYILTGDIVALVYHAESGEIKTVKKSSHSFSKKGKSTPVYLNSQDRLLVLSPGVLQTRSIKGQQYSLSKVKKVLQEEKSSSVHQIRNRLFYELKAFSEGQPSEHDQSALVMEVQQSILKLAT